MNRLQTFILGWKRRSRMLLDNAGCPLWLQRLRCPDIKGRGTFLNEWNGTSYHGDGNTSESYSAVDAGDYVP